MLKKIISPIQSWLLRKHQCVGCGRPLKLGETKTYGGNTKVFCACGRIFIDDNGTYRRALFDEV